VSVASWRLKTAQVPLTTVGVFHAGLSGMDVQLGNLVLWVESAAHWDDINSMVKLRFAELPERRTIPTRTDSLLPTVNLSGACYEGDE
jgi:hypothetical protein